MIDKSSLLKSQGSLYLEFILKDGLFHKMLLLSLMEFLTGSCNLKDSSHPLKDFYKVLPSGKRLRCLACKTARFYESFVPTSVVLYNNSQPNTINM